MLVNHVTHIRNTGFGSHHNWVIPSRESQHIIYIYHRIYQPLAPSMRSTSPLADQLWVTVYVQFGLHRIYQPPSMRSASPDQYSKSWVAIYVQHGYMLHGNTVVTPAPGPGPRERRETLQSVNEEVVKLVDDLQQLAKMRQGICWFNDIDSSYLTYCTLAPRVIPDIRSKRIISVTTTPQVYAMRVFPKQS